MAVQNNITRAIVKGIDRTGIPHASAGYKYMIACVEEVLKSGSRTFVIRKVYEAVAMSYGVQWTTVERAIRLAVKKAPEPTKKKTNKELISQLVDQLYMI